MLLKRWLLQREESLVFKKWSRETGSGWGSASPLRAVGCSLAPCLCSARKPGLALPSFPSMPSFRSFLYSHLSLLPLVILDHGFQICKNLDPVKYFAAMPCSFCCCTEQRSNDKLPEFAVQQCICNTEREKGLDTIQSLTFSLVSGVAERFPLFSIAERDKNDLYYCDPVVSFRPAWLNLW